MWDIFPFLTQYTFFCVAYLYPTSNSVDSMSSEGQRHFFQGFLPSLIMTRNSCPKPAHYILASGIETENKLL